MAEPKGAARPRVSARPVPFVPRVVALAMAPLIVVGLAGLPYYAAPLAERLRHPMHDWLKPSGTIGQSAGFLSFALFLFLWLYPIRKRFRRLAFTGSLGKWLDVHIVAGLLVPVAGAIHAAWRFDGLIGMGYAAMFVVSLSGIVGRYLYVHIPRSRDGLELSRAAVADERRALLGRLVETTGMPAARIERLLRPVPTPEAGQGAGAHLKRMITDDFERRRAIRRLIAGIRSGKASASASEPGSGPAPAVPSGKALRETARLARREIALAQQIRLLEGTNRIFRFWHVAHRPFAVTAFLAVAVHVAVVVALGATWLR